MAEKYSDFIDSLDAKKKKTRSKKGRSRNLKSRVEIREKWEAKKTKEEAERGDRESETDQFSGKDIKNKGEEREVGKGDGTKRKLAENREKEG